MSQVFGGWLGVFHVERLGIELFLRRWRLDDDGDGDSDGSSGQSFVSLGA